MVDSFSTKIIMPTNRLVRKFVICQHCGIIGRAYRTTMCIRICYRHAQQHGPVLEHPTMTMHSYKGLPFRPQLQDFL